MQKQLTSDDLLELRAQALRLANKLYEKLIDGSFPTIESRVRARNVWMRLCARADRRALAFHKVFTQQIASSVEREAFPDLRCSFCDRVLDDNGKCPSQYCESNDFLNSGDTFAAPPAGAPVLSATTLGAFEHVNVKSLQKGQGSTFEQRAEQGSGSLPYYFRRIPGVRFWWYAKPVSRLRDAYPGKTLKLTVYANWARGVRHV